MAEKYTFMSFMSFMSIAHSISILLIQLPTKNKYKERLGGAPEG
jgi:hypothetical protein